MINGRTVWRGVAPGSIVLLQASEPTDWLLDGQFEMLHIYLDHERIPCHKKPSGLLLPFRDPLLFQIGNATASALRESGGKGGHVNYLLESMQQYLFERYFLDDKVKPQDTQTGLAGFTQKKIEQHISSHLAEDIPVETLADIANLSPGHFSRAFRKTYNLSPHQFLIEKRIDQAVKLLRETDWEIQEIAQTTGFSSASHLCTHFKKRMAVSPGKYRR